MKLLKVKLLVDKKVVQETLNRIGISNKRKKILYPSCYIYENNDEYYIAHFKQMFGLYRSYDTMSEDDVLRRNSIVFCLKSWGLVDIDDRFITPHNCYIFVLNHKEKSAWKVSHKINLFTLRNKFGIDI